MSLFSFMIQYLNETKYHLTNNFEGAGLKHYGCKLFPPIVQMHTQTQQACGKAYKT